jgi:membrane protease YdiL (CAAX protease family)
MSRTAFLRLEWLLSLALVVLSVGWALVRDLSLLDRLLPTPASVALGMTAGAALWGTIPLLLRSAAMRRVWDEVLQPFSRALATRDLVAIALLSGISEELFFRGILLPEIGLALSSLGFGALHALCAVYLGWATLVGAGFGALALATDSLVAPITAHAVYNFGALVLVRRAALRATPTTAAAPASVPTAIASPHGIG